MVGKRQTVFVEDSTRAAGTCQKVEGPQYTELYIYMYIYLHHYWHI